MIIFDNKLLYINYDICTKVHTEQWQSSQKYNKLLSGIEQTLCQPFFKETSGSLEKGKHL